MFYLFIMYIYVYFLKIYLGVIKIIRSNMLDFLVLIFFLSIFHVGFTLKNIRITFVGK